MKTLKFLSTLLLIFAFLAVVRCSEDEPAPLVSVTGKVTFTNAAGTAANAVGAVVYLANSATSISSIADANGDYKFANVAAGAYTVTASYFTDNKNVTARLDGLTFATDVPVDVTVASADVVQDLALISTGQTGIEALSANYSWTGSAYANTGTWTYDATHSPLRFEFPYRDHAAEFGGTFSQLNKAIFSFDPNNLSNASFDFEVDVASINTLAPGGRDPKPPAGTIAFNPTTLFSNLGCIFNNTFVITADGPVSDATPQTITTNTKRYAKFVSTSVAKLGDGYVAKGNVTFLGITKATDIWFKAVPSWVDASNGRTYSGFEGRFVMNAKADYGVDSSSVNDAPVTIFISIVLYHN